MSGLLGLAEAGTQILNDYSSQRIRNQDLDKQLSRDEIKAALIQKYAMERQVYSDNRADTRQERSDTRADARQRQLAADARALASLRDRFDKENARQPDVTGNVFDGYNKAVMIQEPNQPYELSDDEKFNDDDEIQGLMDMGERKQLNIGVKSDKKLDPRVAGILKVYGERRDVLLKRLENDSNNPAILSALQEIDDKENQLLGIAQSAPESGGITDRGRSIVDKLMGVAESEKKPAQTPEAPAAEEAEEPTGIMDTPQEEKPLNRAEQKRSEAKTRHAAELDAKSRVLFEQYQDANEDELNAMNRDQLEALLKAASYMYSNGDESQRKDAKRLSQILDRIYLGHGKR